MNCSGEANQVCPEGTVTWQLPNGIRVVAEPMPSVRSVAIGLWVFAGSRHEPESAQGVSHFIEHLMFKGTERRSARQIAEAMDVVGGQLNAFTTKEYTCYHARVLDEHLPLAVDVISDMLLDSSLRDDDIQREKGVILEEIGMYEDAPDELVHDLFAQAIWPSHPLGRSVLGQPRTISGLERADITRYLESAYTPAKAVISLAGSFEEDAVRELLARHLGKWHNGGGGLPEISPAFHRTINLRAKDTELLNVCIGGEGLPIGHPDIYALSIMSNILGGGPSSRLFQEVREERGLAYSVFSYTSAFSDGGVFAVYCGAGPERIRPAMEIVGQELRKLCAAGVSHDELYRAKEQLKSNITMALESTGSRMNRIGRAMLMMGQVVSIDDVLKRINRVSLEDIQRVAAKFCDPARLAIAAIGPDPERLDLEGAVIG